MLSPTYKQRNEDFRKLFKQLPDTERLIVGERGDLCVGAGRKAASLTRGSPSESVCLGTGRGDIQSADPVMGAQGGAPCVMISREPRLGGVVATLVSADGPARDWGNYGGGVALAELCWPFCL